jgi:hypothetical protein
MSEEKSSGNIVIGLVVGLFCGCPGLLVVAFVGGRDTKKGAVIGFVVQLVLGGIGALVNQLAMQQ